MYDKYVLLVGVKSFIILVNILMLCFFVVLFKDGIEVSYYWVEKEKLVIFDENGFLFVLI